MAAGLDRAGSVSHNHRSTIESWSRSLSWLALGGNLLLWKLLVAYISDDPVCAYFALAGLSSPPFTNCSGCRFPVSVQSVFFAPGRPVWSGRDVGGADPM